jgi:hypothetical protein
MDADPKNMDESLAAHLENLVAALESRAQAKKGTLGIDHVDEDDEGDDDGGDERNSSEEGEGAEPDQADRYVRAPPLLSAREGNFALPTIRKRLAQWQRRGVPAPRLLLARGLTCLSPAPAPPHP